MSKLIKKIFVITLVFAMIFAITGCGEKKDDTMGSVYMLNFKPEISQYYTELAKEYTKETGIPVKVVTAASGTYEQTLKSEVAKSNAPTIFQVNGPTGFKAWKDYCADIGNTMLYTELKDKNLAITEGNGVYAVPYAIEGYGIIYNEAILQKYFELPTKKTQFTSAEEINNFAKLKALVEDMQSQKEALGIDGVFASTSLGAGEQWRWQSHLANVPFYHEFNESNGYDTTILAGNDADMIDFKYASEYKNLFDLYINNSVTDKKLLGSKSTQDSMSEFALGRCAMVQNGDWAWSQINEVSGNKVSADDIKMLPLYTGHQGEEKQGICVGTESYIAVNSKVSEAKQKASIDFLEWLFTSERGKDYVVNKLGFNAPFNTFSDDEKPDDPLSREVLRWLDKDVNNIEWTFLSFPSEEFKNKFGASLLEYAQGNKDWDSAVNDIKESWKSERAK